MQILQLKVILFNCEAGTKITKYLMSRDNWKSEQHTKCMIMLKQLLLWLMMVVVVVVVDFGWSACQQCLGNVR